MLDAYERTTRGPHANAILLSSSTVTPTVRMVVASVSVYPDGDTGFSWVTERFAVVAIENRYINTYTHHDDPERSAALTHAEAVDTGWANGHCDNQIEPIICIGGGYGTLIRLRDFLRNQQYTGRPLSAARDVETVVCTWHHSEDDVRLAPIEAELKRECLDQLGRQPRPVIAAENRTQSSDAA